MRSSQFLVHALCVGLAISAPLTIDQPSLDARHVAPSAASSQGLATHTLRKRLTADELGKGIVLDAGKGLTVSYLLALVQSLIAFPKPANSDPPVQEQVPQPGVPSPQNPSGGYYPGAPINQDGNPQSYYDPRTNQQVSYQDPRLQDPRYVAALQQQESQIASAGGQQAPQDSEPVQGFGSTVADFGQITPQDYLRW